ncbi:autotransporter assembly complex protein TamA [Undibacterium oligocarboniphilum]|uniref:BamA/TamA family outer membrane protein n=1 Tax=Undibacterium oligocarboniphilum TaxID=666702 RepID=A0A850QEA9_9BURK|nr:BamA/TamA family outer membrane protein [Undibacterium oligocarboniphilum]MBC3871295.1 BamA/TamA family outer membrane protein [Undibacterium oligocarboniphilum]NVO78792.1 BamA/TamA family outer membrane protein [Undibacterium oligocarboniphilum]
MTIRQCSLPLLLSMLLVGWCAPVRSLTAQTVPAAQEHQSTETPPAAETTHPDDVITDPESIVRSTSGRFALQAESAGWAALLREHIAEFSPGAEAQNITPSLIRRLRQDISGILATEGYFSPQIEFRNLEETTAPAVAQGTAGNAPKLIQVTVSPGPRTIIAEVGIHFQGALASTEPLAQERQQRLIHEWGLTKGQPFREDDWSEAKNQLLESLRADTYAAARIADSAANVDADQQRAVLALEVDSGPVFRLGELRVNGLKRYPSWLLSRYQPPVPGELYSRARLLEFQRNLQNSPYFGTVAVSIDADPEQAFAIPVDVSVVERRARDLSFGVGYSSNTGFRGEVAYRDRDILEKAWDLRSAIRIEQKRQLGYADIYLPPHDNQLDSFGVIADRQDVSGVLSLRNAVGIKRTSHRGLLEQRLALKLIRERKTVEGEPQEISKALVASIGWTWRDVDDAFAPRRGEIYQLDLDISDKALFSDQRFIRGYGKYQRWVPVGKTDSVILRAEAGQVFAQGDAGIPEDYLFRTGGSTTVRGYAYQSLGIQHLNAVTGGRVMGVASAEYVHWLNSTWGAATFVDVGDAAETWRDFSLRQAIGIGGRYRTPAGPIALDMAYGRQSKRVRLDFSIAIAF